MNFSFSFSARRQFAAGARTQLLNLASVIPFGLAAGAFTSGVLGDVTQATALQSLMFAGRGQMVAMQLYRDHAPLAFILLAALVINLRNMMYGAAIARHFGHLSWWWRAGLAFLLVDLAYAMAITHLDATADATDAPARHFFYLGGGLTVFGAWSLAGLLGAFLGTSIPASWGLDFVPNLSFIYVLVGNMRKRSDVACGVAAGLVATAAAGWPWQSGLFAGAVAGLMVGMLVKEPA